MVGECRQSSDDRGTRDGIFAEEETICECRFSFLIERGVFWIDSSSELSITITSSSELSSIVIAVALEKPIFLIFHAIVVDETIEDESMKKGKR